MTPNFRETREASQFRVPASSKPAENRFPSLPTPVLPRRSLVRNPTAQGKAILRIGIVYSRCELETEPGMRGGALVLVVLVVL